MGNYVAAILKREKAEEKISGSKGALISSLKKKIVKSELLYLPVYIFNVRISDSRGKSVTEILSVDAIKGEFAVYTSSGFTLEPEVISFKPYFVVDKTTARDIALSEYGRTIFRNNLRNHNKLTIDTCSEGEEIYYPYWISYFTRKGKYDFEAVDAVGGEKTGIRMKPVFIDLILQFSSAKA